MTKAKSEFERKGREYALERALRRTFFKNQHDEALVEKGFSEGWESGILIGKEQGRKQTLSEVRDEINKLFSVGLYDFEIKERIDGWLEQKIKAME